MLDPVHDRGTSAGEARPRSECPSRAARFARADRVSIFRRGGGALAAPGKLTAIGAIISCGLIWLNGRDSAQPAVELMAEHRLRAIPVVTEAAGEKSAVGVVTRGRLAAALRS